MFDDKATFDFDIYDIEWTGMQATEERAAASRSCVNAGNARVLGAETSFSYRVMQDLTVGGTAAYTNAYLTTPSPVLGVLTTGARLPLSPTFNFALNGTYAYEIGDGFSGAVNVSDVYGTATPAIMSVPPRRFRRARAIRSTNWPPTIRSI